MLLEILRYLLLVVEALCCLLLVGVILLQRTKSQGAGLAFGAGVGESLFGTRVGNVLTKTTVILASAFLVNTTVLALMGASRGPKSLADGIRATTPVPTAPAGGTLTPPAAPPAGGAEPVESVSPPAPVAEGVPGPVETPPAAPPTPAPPVAPTPIPAPDAGVGRDSDAAGQR